MKHPRLILAGSIFAALHAHAATLYWDINAATAGASAGTTATGAWNGANLFWNDQADGTDGGGLGTFTAVTTSADDLFLSAGTNATGTFTITLTGTQSAKSLNFEEGTVTLTGGTVSIDAGGVVGTTAAATVINSAVTLNAPQNWSTTGLLTVGGALTNGANVLTLTGGTVAFTNTGVAGTGGLTVNGGTLQVGNNAFLGAGNVLTLQSGKISSNNTNSQVISNAFSVTAAGAVTLGDAAKNGALTFNGTQSMSNTPVISLAGGTVTFGTSALSLAAGTNATFAGAATLNLTGGFNLNGGTSTLTLNSTATNTISGGFTGAAGTLILAGSSQTTTVGTLTTSANVVQVNSATGGVFAFNSSTGTYTGGTTLTNGTLQLNASSAITTGAITGGPLGFGTFTVAGGGLRPNSSAQTIHNSLAITGDFDFNRNGSGSNLTFSPNLVTSPAAGTATLSGARTITAYAATLIVNGPVAGAGTPSLTVRGPGLIQLLNATATASTYGNVVVGQTAASGSLGGRLEVDTQNAMGTGSAEIRYGGILNQTGFAAAGANAVTVRKGGSLFLSTPAGSPAHGAALVFETGSTIGGFGSNNVTVNLATATVPSEGVMNFAVSSSSSSRPVNFNTGTWPSFTGTMAFAGANSGSHTLANNVTLSSVADSARTLVFNNAGGRMVFNSGITLNADLTVKGGGNTGLGGAFTGQDGTSLGALTNTGGARAVTIAMAPGGVVAANTGSAYTGTLLIASGALAVSSPGSAGGARAFPNIPAIVLDGGTFRATNNTNTATTMTDPFTIKTGGGVIEHFQTSNGPIASTLSGSITPDGGGAGAVTLRYGGVAGSGGLLILSGNNSGFASGFTLATSNGRGHIQFTGVNSTGAAGNVITVGDGLVFGFDSAATLTGTLGKFTTTTSSVLSLANMAAAAIDLSPSGLNRDLWLGTGGPNSVFNFSGTITPFASTYKLAPGENQLVLTGANILTGARSVLARPPVLAAGAYATSQGTGSGFLQFNAAQDYTGATTISGLVANATALPNATAGLFGQRIDIGPGGGLTGTSAVTVEKNGLFTVTGTVASPGTITVANLPILVHSAATFRIGGLTAADNNGVSNRVASTSTLTLGAAGEGGGTFTMAFPATGAHAQTLASLALGAGSSTFNTVNTPNGALNLAFTGTTGGAGYTRSAGGVVNVTSAAGFAPSFTNAPTAAGGSAVVGTSAPILVGAFLNNADLVAAAVGTLAAPAYTAQSVAGSWAADQNITTTGTTAFSGTVPGGGLSINSLRNNSPTAAGTIAIGASDTLTIASGMILNVGAQPITFNGGSITSGNGTDLIVHNSPNTITFNSAITGSIALTKLGANTVRLAAASGNTFAGINSMGSGTIEIATANAWGNAAAINLMGGTIRYVGTAHTLTSSYPINVSPVGGGFVNGQTGTLTVQGAVTLNGNLNLQAGSGGNGGDGTLAFAGNISGPGTLQYGAGGSSNGRYRILLSGTNSFTGGINGTSSGGGAAATNLFAQNSTAIGTGPISIARGLNLYFDTNAGGAAAFANPMSLGANAVVSFWGLGSGLATAGGTAPVTLSGSIFANGGLTFQGHATADDQVSEIVLTGPLSAIGTGGNSLTGGAYSYGDAAASQNFVNGPGGIGLGVTAMNTLTTTTANGTRVEDPGGTASAVANGALGFVRFGGAQSFIPGTAGPGYLSALRKAGSGNGARFGYLLTGGATYALPEGKGFVIGSLGTGAQVGGTLGTAGGGTATLTGSPKLAGFPAGDVNIHANAAADAQTLTVLARAAADVLRVGTIPRPVVFTPTYGDSGAASALTLLSDRTGATVLTKRGLGEAALDAVQYRRLDGVTDAAASFSWTIAEGTLTSPDAASLAASLTFTGGTLKAAGAFNYANPVTLSASGTVDTNGNAVTLSGPIGGAGGALTKTGANSLTLSGAQTYTTLNANAGTTNVNSALGTGTSTINANATTHINASQTLAALNIAAGVEVTFGNGLPFAGEPGKAAFGGVAVVPEPGSLASLSLGLGLLLGLRRRRA